MPSCPFNPDITRLCKTLFQYYHTDDGLREINFDNLDTSWVFWKQTFLSFLNFIYFFFSLRTEDNYKSCRFSIIIIARGWSRKKKKGGRGFKKKKGFASLAKRERKKQGGENGELQGKKKKETKFWRGKLAKDLGVYHQIFSKKFSNGQCAVENYTLRSWIFFFFFFFHQIVRYQTNCVSLCLSPKNFAPCYFE